MNPFTSPSPHKLASLWKESTPNELHVEEEHLKYLYYDSDEQNQQMRWI